MGKSWKDKKRKDKWDRNDRGSKKNRNSDNYFDGKKPNKWRGYEDGAEDY